MTRKQLENRAARLAQKFFDDAQALFDQISEQIDDQDDAMAIAEGPVFEALCLAQGSAEDVVNERDNNR